MLRGICIIASLPTFRRFEAGRKCHHKPGIQRKKRRGHRRLHNERWYAIPAHTAHPLGMGRSLRDRSYCAFEAVWALQRCATLTFSLVQSIGQATRSAALLSI